jgi:DNA-binding NarL/FixJ family response regulator
VVAFQSTSTSTSPSGSTAERATADAGELTLPVGVALEIEDMELDASVRAHLATRSELIEAWRGEAAVVITDADQDESFSFDHVPVLHVRLSATRTAEPNTLRSTEPQVILAAAALLAAGYQILPPRPAAGELEGGNGQAPHLSMREMQVAALLVEGASNKVIARRLNISVHTAKFHVNAVVAKLGAHNRSDAITLALRNGVVTL